KLKQCPHPSPHHHTIHYTSASRHSRRLFYFHQKMFPIPVLTTKNNKHSVEYSQSTNYATGIRLITNQFCCNATISTPKPVHSATKHDSPPTTHPSRLIITSPIAPLGVGVYLCTMSRVVITG